MANYIVDMLKSALGIGGASATPTSTKRIAYVDLAKGVGIFLVVFIHGDDWFGLEYQAKYAIVPA